VIAVANGFRVGEVDVPHRARLHGESKFGRARFWRGFFDLITIKFLTTYNSRPFHILGGLGLAFAAIGGGLLTWMFIDLLSGAHVGNRPALSAGVLLVLVGVQLAATGLIAELIVSRTRQREQRHGPAIAASGGSQSEVGGTS
jgi:dolichol-phosphate mannosyltransferase